MTAVHVASVGLCGPGMADWAAGRAVLRGEAPLDGTLPKPVAAILPPAERRRSGQATRFALQVAQEAMTQAAFPPAQAAVVFASSDADSENLHHILESLAQSEHEVSPTRFHNSVHNAAAGYWNIATGARTPANSLAAFDASFAAGLLEAAVQVAAENIPVLLVAFDLPFPSPLNEVRTITAPFAAALLLTPQATATSLARLQISLCDEQTDTVMSSAELEALRKGNPAARALPLLQAIANMHGECPPPTHPHPNLPLAPARGVPAESGSKAARSGEKGEGTIALPPAGGGKLRCTEPVEVEGGAGQRLSLNYGVNSLIVEVEKASK